MKGIDVSNHNGVINWNLVKDQAECVYIKATEGTTYKDPLLSCHYNGAKAVGLKTGFYHFLVGSSEPETQAENFYNNIKDKENNLLPCLDLEHSNNEPKNYMDYALRFINKFKALSNMNICIYACPSFINEYLDNRLSNFPLWVAHYGVNTPTGNNIWGNSYAGHQYSETGKIQGVNGNVDMNNFNDSILAGNQVNTNNNYSDNVFGKVAELQRICNSLLHTCLVIDNIYGNCTDSAVKRLPLAGLLYHTPDLTRWIQLRLGLKVDGIFGNETDKAVRNWQATHRLKVDGIAGYNTIKSLALA